MTNREMYDNHRQRHPELYGDRKGYVRLDEFDACVSESELHDDIIKACKNRGWIYFHGSMAHKTRRTVGEPDFTIIADGGRVFFIECKAKNRKRSPEQMGVALAAQMLGTTVHLVESLSQFLEIVGK